MLLLLGIPVVVLSALVGAGWYFEWFDNSPSGWELFFGIPSIAGFTIGFVMLPQRLWGRPKLRMDFHDGVAEGERHISVMLANPPVRNWLLRRLGVHREAVQSLVVQFRVVEAGSGQVLVPVHQALIHTDEDPNQGRNRIALPPTYSVAATALVVVWDYAIGRAQVPETRVHPAYPLQPGQYRTIITAFVDGDQVGAWRQFIVGDTPSDLVWVQPAKS